MQIDALVHTAYEVAKSKGFHEVERPIPESLMLIVTEVAEAMEDVRTGSLSTTISDKGKPEGFPSELADIVIRVADLCGQLGIDLQTEIEHKLIYNNTRSYRHGGKLM